MRRYRGFGRGDSTCNAGVHVHRLYERNVVEKKCEIFVMADRHQEGDLKDAVENYIISHDKDIFGSAEWKCLMDTNPKLAAETMFKKVYGK
ncbi:hypothetical protein CEXT_230871 [Caerostris extrusa]|uniref:Uncharacterized protein n=1 Tax=Caerostris extrusa TaxID=172846 RepID=A0AAV4RMR4_CAEEX|nr:hypothetical protein CEXT_230871 [Caerostris extrusa]